MADLTSLVAGGAKSLLKDKAAEFMSPQQMELARFAISPQAYLADKGIAAVAQLLGYGDQLKELNAGAQAQKEYGKEVVRDAIGNALPGALGDFVRATPKMTDADYNASMEELRQSTNTPENAARFDAQWNPDSQYNVGSQNYVGPQHPQNLNSDVYHDNVQQLLEMLGPYQQPSGSNTRSLTNTQSNMAPAGYVFDPVTGTVVPDDYDTQVGPGYTFDPNTGTAVPMDSGALAPDGYVFDSNLGMNVPMDSGALAPEGYTYDSNLGMNVPTGGGKLEDLRQIQQNKRGGQICGCKH